MPHVVNYICPVKINKALEIQTFAAVAFIFTLGLISLIK